MAARYGGGLFSGPKLFGLVVVILLHILLVWALQSGLAHSVVAKIKGPVEAEIIEEVKPDEELPPPPPPDIAPPPPFVPPPLINIQAAPSASAITQVQAEKPVPPQPDTWPEPKRTNTNPEYPPSEKRAGHEGNVEIQVYVTVDGRVSEAKLAKSSGYPLLDQAALAHVQNKWRFAPARKAGVASASWFTVIVQFQLKNAR